MRPLPFLLLPLTCSLSFGQTRFTDDFEGGLGRWEIDAPHAVSIVDSGDPAHGRVLELQPDGGVRALVRGSDGWGPVRVDGDVLFPDDAHNYLGFIYNYRRTPTRTDYGNIYIKGNGSYLRVNPWRDGNVSRLLYEEYRTPLTGRAAVEIGRWQHFRAEVVGSACHFYVGDMSVPQLTFSLLELDGGLIGFEPRIVGAPVLIDNIEIRSINSFGYEGPAIPDIAYQPEALLTDWQVLGPLPAPDPRIGRSGGSRASEDDSRWRPFETDSRGAVVTGRFTEFSGGRPVAYFRTVVEAERAGEAVLHFSTTEELELWVNGRQQGFVYRNGYLHDDWNAWFDFWKSDAHAGRRVPITLREGRNTVIVRAYSGQFAAGGFYVRLESGP